MTEQAPLPGKKGAGWLFRCLFPTRVRQNPVVPDLVPEAYKLKAWNDLPVVGDGPATASTASAGTSAARLPAAQKSIVEHGSSQTGLRGAAASGPANRSPAASPAPGVSARRVADALSSPLPDWSSSQSIGARRVAEALSGPLPDWTNAPTKASKALKAVPDLSLRGPGFASWERQDGSMPFPKELLDEDYVSSDLDLEALLPPLPDLRLEDRSGLSGSYSQVAPPASSPVKSLAGSPTRGPDSSPLKSPAFSPPKTGPLAMQQFQPASSPMKPVVRPTTFRKPSKTILSWQDTSPKEKDSPNRSNFMASTFSRPTTAGETETTFPTSSQSMRSSTWREEWNPGHEQSWSMRHMSVDTRAASAPAVPSSPTLPKLPAMLPTPNFPRQASLEQLPPMPKLPAKPMDPASFVKDQRLVAAMQRIAASSVVKAAVPPPMAAARRWPSQGPAEDTVFFDEGAVKAVPATSADAASRSKAAKGDAAALAEAEAKFAISELALSFASLDETM